MITRLRPLATNHTAALVKAPKLLWTDCGLAAWLAGIRSSAEVMTRMDSGFWLEQTLFQKLETWQSFDPRQRKLHFWRDRAGHEVDFILEEAGKFMALEIKASSQVTANDANGIRAWREDLKRKSSLVKGVVLHSGKARPLEDDVLALPWGWMVPASWEESHRCAEDLRHNEQATEEQVNARLKDELGGRMIRVRGLAKMDL